MKKRIVFLLVLFVALSASCGQKQVKSAEQPQVAIQSTDYPKMIIAKVYVKPGREADFISAAQVMIENSNKEEGCMEYMLYQDPYEKTNLIFVERYKNQAAVDAHFATSYFKEFGTKTGDMTTKAAEIKILDIAGEQ